MFIPLSSFVDLSDPLLPKGHWTTGGLNSAMSNPLISKTDSTINFRSQVVFNQRPRDLVNTPMDLDTQRCADMGAYYGTYWTRNEDGAGDSGTLGVGQIEGFITTDEWDMINFGDTHIFDVERDTIVYTTATKVLTGTPWAAGRRYQTGIGVGDPNGDDRFYLRGPSTLGIMYARYTALAGDPWPVVFTLNSNSYEKWLLISLTFKLNDITKCNVRVKGGQFSSVTTYNASAFTNFDPSLSLIRKIQTPGSSAMWGGGTTVACYSGTTDGGTTGLDANDVDWNVFDSEHTCGSCSVSGNLITFSCTGSVAWEIYTGGQWRNATGGYTKEYFDTGTHTLKTSIFTAVRPTLKNSGLLNADTVSTLHWVNVESHIPCYYWEGRAILAQS